MPLVDTAEMYADGGAEEVVGEAIQQELDREFPPPTKKIPLKSSEPGSPQNLLDRPI
jgi:diketogulonate reductase-like aldo/keto reductase